MGHYISGYPYVRHIYPVVYGTTVDEIDHGRLIRTVRDGSWTNILCIARRWFYRATHYPAVANVGASLRLRFR